ncbi:SURF1 family protein [Thermobifida halotolerans]|uniref:SURF1-like protein n=1 Tax=Thermobifida halotolerans TaxID=483545 RepID=A0A399G0J4_9ACTN|nr:SURF1 family protein [Thermobifida halotolerans]UOE19214.1 SURF1 family protein [Thermobifida halotolerans]
MLAFHALLLVVVPSFIALGLWQYERAQAKAAVVELQETNLAGDPVPLDELTAVGEEVTRQDRWRQVTVTGTYDSDRELLVRNRGGSGGVGMHVLTPLVTEDGTAVLVNRGWVRQPPTAAGQPEVPPPAEGRVTVTGRLQISETPENTGIRPRDGLPEGQIMIIDVAAIAEELPYDLYGGYVELVEEAPEPAAAPEPVEVAEVNTGMNFSYAVQWWAFTAIAIGGWVFLVRREVQEAETGDTPPAPENSDTTPSPTPGA